MRYPLLLLAWQSWRIDAMPPFCRAIPNQSGCWMAGARLRLSLVDANGSCEGMWLVAYDEESEERFSLR